MSNKQIGIGLAVVAIVIAAIAGFFFFKNAGLLGNTTASFWDSAGGYKVDGVSIIDGNGLFAALLTTDAGTLRSYSLATSTGDATLSETYLAGYDTIVVTPTGANGTKTLTFPASSTLSTWLPTAGDMQETCFINASTTAATTLTWAASTGIDLEVASSTTGGPATTLVTPADGATCFKFIRKAATATTFDILVLMQRFADGD